MGYLDAMVSVYFGTARDGLKLFVFAFPAVFAQS